MEHRSESAPSVDSDDNYKWRVFVAVGLSFFTSVMAMSMVFVALPNMASSFDVTLKSIGWVVIVESLIIAATLLPFGRLADVVGRRRIHLIGLTIFGIGGAATALAPSFGLLIVARIVMAIGNSLGQSVGTAILVAAFPPTERGKAVGSQTTAVSIGGISGPLFGGILIEAADWRLLFLVILVPVAISLVAGYVILDEERLGGTLDGVELDRRGFVLSALTIVATIVTLNNPFGLSWASVPMVGSALAAIGLGVWFVRHERATPEPMLRVSMFRDVALSSLVVARSLSFVATASLQILLPVYLISLRSMSETKAGAILILPAVGMGISAQITGRASDRIGSRPFMLAGLSVLGIGALVFAAMSGATAVALVVGLVLVNGLAMGSFNVPNNSAILGAIPPTELGVMGALTNLARTVGTVGGQAMAAAIVAGVMAGRGFDVPLDEIESTPGAGDAFVAGWGAAFVAAAVVAAIALFLVAIPGRSKRSGIT